MNNNIAIRTTADAVAFAAPLLGYVPTNSVVIYCMRTDDTSNYVHMIMRIDATTSTERAAALPVTTRLAAHNLSGVILLGIADAPLQPHTRAILDTLRDAMNRNNIDVLARITTHTVAHADTWTDLDTGNSGPTLAYSDTILSVVLPTVAADRDTVAAEFQTTEPPAPIIDATDSATLVVDTFEHVATAIANNLPATPALATRVGVVITGNVHLRDAMLHLSAEMPAPAAKFWTAIARPLRGAPRVEALTIAAIALYITADGPRAGMALEAAFATIAEHNMPTPTLTGLVDTLIQTGVSPDAVRDLLTPDKR